MRALTLSKWSVRWLAAAWLLVAGATPATAELITIDFESTPNGAFPIYTESGVTFRAVTGDLTSTLFGLAPNGTRGLLGATLPYQEILAVITGGATSVFLDLGDHGGDADLLFLQAFDALGNLLGTVTELFPEDVEGMRTLGFTHPDIASVRFGARVPALNGSSIYADSFRFESAAITEPASVALLAAGAVGLLAWRQGRGGRRDTA